MPPRDAPPETPSIWGQASGLPSKACRTTPQTAMPPPIAIPNSTRGRRARKSISASAVLEKRFFRASDKSIRTGPSKVQAEAERTSKINRALLTNIIFLRSSTFTAGSFSGVTLVEAVRMYVPGPVSESVAHARPRPEYRVRVVSINLPFFYGRDRFYVAPASRRRRGVRTHTRFDDDLRSFRDDVLVRQIKP